MKFTYDVPFGAVADFVDGALTIVIKEDEWNEAQLQAFQQPLQGYLVNMAGLAFVLVEGGPLDTCDVIFDAYRSDEKDSFFAEECLTVRLFCLDSNNEVVKRAERTLSKEVTAQFQNQMVEMGDEEFEVNVNGIQAHYEPSELGRKAWYSFRF